MTATKNTSKGFAPNAADKANAGKLKKDALCVYNATHTLIVACKKWTATDASRKKFARAMFVLCRTSKQRDAKSPESRAFYAIRNTANNPRKMGEGNAYSVLTDNVDKDSANNLTQCPTIEKCKTAKSRKKFTREQAVESFSQRIGTFPLALLGTLLELTPAELKKVIGEVYEKHSASVRNSAPAARRASKKKVSKKAASKKKVAKKKSKARK